MSAAQIRLQKDIGEFSVPNIKVTFPHPGNLFQFQLALRPTEGYYKDGRFLFRVDIPSSYPIEPPKVKCLQRIYHPNIDTDGNVCLNILREEWLPVLSLNLLLVGLNFLFAEPNPSDPLNKTAANDFVKSRAEFVEHVKKTMRGGSLDGIKFDKVAV